MWRFLSRARRVLSSCGARCRRARSRRSPVGRLRARPRHAITLYAVYMYSRPRAGKVGLSAQPCLIPQPTAVTALQPGHTQSSNTPHTNDVYTESTQRKPSAKTIHIRRERQRGQRAALDSHSVDVWHSPGSTQRDRERERPTPTPECGKRALTTQALRATPTEQPQITADSALCQSSSPPAPRHHSLGRALVARSTYRVTLTLTLRPA